MVDSTAAHDRGMDTSSLFMGGERANAERASRPSFQGFDGVERSGPEHVSALLKMGAQKQDAGDFPGAEEAFQRALELGERVLGPTNPALVAVLTNLAGARILSGKPESAEPLVIRALSMTENALGEHDPDFAILVNDLARLCLRQSAHAVAEPLLLRLLAMKRSKGDDHPEVATVLGSLAAVRQALGRHESAEQLWRRVLDIRERTLAPNHLGLATALERLADSCSARGKIGEALELLQRALTIRELTLGAGNPTLRVSRDRIADLQLQASEEALDPSIVEPPTSAPEKYRLLPADHSVQNVSRPVREKNTPKVRIEKPVVEPRKPAAAASIIEPKSVPAAASVIDIAPAKEEIKLAPQAAVDHGIVDDIRPASEPPVDAAIWDDFEPSQPELANYRDVILNIRQELEDEENAAPTAMDRVKGIGVAAAAVLRQRQKEIALTAGAVALVAGLTTVSQALINSQQAAPAQEASAGAATSQTTAPSATQAAGGTVALVNDLPLPPAVASAEETPVAPSPRARVVEQRTSARKATDSRAPRAISIPTMSSAVMSGFDSIVRARTPGVRSAVEPVDLTPLPVATAAPGNISFALESQVAPPQRARLIGKLPVPRYPAQMANTQGEVTVRFEVDASGRPVRSTLAVLASTNESFTTEVFKMIPTLRFEPALSGGANPKPMTDVVQLEIAFRPTK